MKFKNKKSGDIYILLGTAINCTNNQPNTLMAIYKEDSNDITVFVREYDEFLIKFEPLTKESNLTKENPVFKQKVLYLLSKGLFDTIWELSAEEINELYDSYASEPKENDIPF